MSDCELLSTCPYFNDTMYEMAKTDKEGYCKGAYSGCGRYMTFKSLERELWNTRKRTMGFHPPA